MNPSDEFLIVALDTDALNEAESFVKRLGESAHFYKVGMELFFATRGEAVAMLRDHGKKVFLDLKLNDIPATISKAVKALQIYAPELLTLFAGHSAIAAAEEAKHPNTKIINVTVLTSDTDSNMVLPAVLKRASLTISSGGDGVVCSGLETKTIRDTFGKNLIVVNPGIRMPGDSANDQSRIVTPRDAFAAGASHIVMGRSITSAADPREKTDAIWRQIRGE